MTRHLAINITVPVAGQGTATVSTELDLDALGDPARQVRVLAGIQDTIGGLLELAAITDEPRGISRTVEEPDPTSAAVELPVEEFVAPTAPEEPKPAPRDRATKGAPRGSVKLSILNLIADHGGTYDGSLSELAVDVGGGPKGSRVDATRKLEAAGLLSFQRDGRSITEISLTGDGWRAIDRTPARTPAERGAGSSYGHQETEEARTPPITGPVDAGPMTTTPFDPDAARAGAAAAL